MYVVMDGEKIEAARRERSLTLREFAKEVGLTENTLRRAERGEAVRLETARKVAACVGVDPCEVARPRRGALA